MIHEVALCREPISSGWGEMAWVEPWTEQRWINRYQYQGGECQAHVVIVRPLSATPTYRWGTRFHNGRLCGVWRAVTGDATCILSAKSAAIAAMRRLFEDAEARGELAPSDID